MKTEKIKIKEKQPTLKEIHEPTKLKKKKKLSPLSKTPIKGKVLEDYHLTGSRKNPFINVLNNL